MFLCFFEVLAYSLVSGRGSFERFLCKPADLGVHWVALEACGGGEGNGSSLIAVSDFWEAWARSAASKKFQFKIFPRERNLPWVAIEACAGDEGSGSSLISVARETRAGGEGNGSTLIAVADFWESLTRSAASKKFQF